MYHYESSQLSMSFWNVWTHLYICYRAKLICLWRHSVHLDTKRRLMEGPKDTLALAAKGVLRFFLSLCAMTCWRITLENLWRLQGTTAWLMAEWLRKPEPPIRWCWKLNERWFWLTLIRCERKTLFRSWLILADKNKRACWSDGCDPAWLLLVHVEQHE
jgi:hypothetical protein